MISAFLADADLNQAIVDGFMRRNHHFDFQSAQAIPPQGLADSKVLAISAEQGRVLVSHNVNTMPSHFREFVLQLTASAFSARLN